MDKLDKTEVKDVTVSFEEIWRQKGWNKIIFEEEIKDEEKRQQIFSAR